MMQFDYNIYLLDNCLYRLLFFVPTIICLVVATVNAVREYHNNHSDNTSLKPVLKWIAFFVAAVIVASANVIPLLRGGIYLLFETEKEAIRITGEIEDTFEIPFFGGMKYDVDQNNGYGEGIVIDGTKYYLMTYGDYKEGDVVTIKVLPKSKLILEMESVR